MITPENKTDNTTPEWLRTIQLNSWEAELLISALVLYALFQIPAYIDQFVLQNIANGSDFHKFFGVIRRSVELLRFGYILHILVRGIWISSVGLSYVFPKGIDRDSLNFKGKFKSELDSNYSLVKSVLKLEELSSIIYGISFLMFGSLLGFGTMAIFFILIIDFLTPDSADVTDTWALLPFLAFFFSYFICVILLFIDFLTNGFFRRSKKTAGWFYVIARIFRVLSLSFLYRRSLLVIISNIKGWKRYLIPLIMLGLIGGFVRINKEIGDNKKLRYLVGNQQTNNLKANYENSRNTNDYLLVTIPSDIVTNNTLKVFLKDIPIFNTLYKANRRKNERWGQFKTIEWEDSPSDSYSQLLNKWLSIQIDTQGIQESDWFISQHPTTFEFGFYTYINIKDLAEGPHNISFSIDTTNMDVRARKIIEESDYNYPFLSNIYFIREKQ